MPTAPTLPSTSTIDKRFKANRLERGDLNDMTAIGQLAAGARAHLMWALVADDDRIVTGLDVVPNSVGAPPGADNMTVWVQPGHGLQHGYLMKTANAVQFAVPANAGPGARTDRVGIRYVDDEGDNALKKRQVVITQTAVVDEAVAAGDGVTKVFDLDHAGVLGSTLVVRVGGTVTAAMLVPGTGLAGVDQLAFPSAVAQGAAITASYTYRTGGTEEAVGLNTRYVAGVQMQYKAGVALDAGYIEVARVTVSAGAVQVTANDISDQRVMLFPAEGMRLADMLGAPRHARYGQSVGLETASSHVAPDWDLRRRSEQVVINGVPLTIPSATFAPVGVLEDAAGGALSDGTWYYYYLCLRRDTDPLDYEPVLSVVVPDSTGQHADSALTKTIGGTPRTFDQDDCLYMGAAYYISAATGFRQQRRVGDEVAYIAQQRVALRDNVGNPGLTEEPAAPEELSLTTFVPPSSPAVRLNVSWTINGDTRSQTLIVSTKPVAGEAVEQYRLDAANAQNENSINSAQIDVPFVNGRIVRWVYSASVAGTEGYVAVMDCAGYSEPLR